VFIASTSTDKHSRRRRRKHKTNFLSSHQPPRQIHQTISYTFLLELDELLAVLLAELLQILNLKNVVLDGLGEGTALTDGHTITLLHREAGRAVDGHGGVTLLVPVVLGDVVQVVTTDDDGALHLGRTDDAGENTTTDANVRCEGALLIDVIGVDCSLRGAEAKTDLLVETHVLATKLTASDLSKHTLTALAQHHLTLISPLNLNVCHPGLQQTKQKKNTKNKNKQIEKVNKILITRQINPS